MEDDRHSEMGDMLSEVHRLESYWRQQQSKLRHELTFSAYGHAVSCRVSDSVLLETARLSAGRYSQCDPVPGAQPIVLSLFTDRTLSGEPMPADLASRLVYRLAGRRLTVTGQDWVRAFVDLDGSFVVALASPAVAQHPHFLSRYICDNLALHLLMRTPAGLMGHLHASCLFHDGKALLLSGPHSAGKSTTALRLMERGYQMLSDSTSFARLWRGGIELLGYPVGELRLRLDTIAEFPRFQSGGQAAMVRDETKMVFSLRERMPEQVAENSVWPDRIVICRIERSADTATRARPVAPDELLEEVWPESIFVDDPKINVPNRVAVSTLLRQASCYRLSLGSNASQLLETIESL